MHTASAHCPLPPHGRTILAVIEKHQRPTAFGGAIFACCDWDLAPSRAPVVILDDPDRYNLDFARGLDWIVVAHEGHPQAHVAAVVRALLAAGAHVAVPVLLALVDYADAIDDTEVPQNERTV